MGPIERARQRLPPTKLANFWSSARLTLIVTSRLPKFYRTQNSETSPNPLFHNHFFTMLAWGKSLLWPQCITQHNYTVLATLPEDFRKLLHSALCIWIQTCILWLGLKPLTLIIKFRTYEYLCGGFFSTFIRISYKGIKMPKIVTRRVFVLKLVFKWWPEIKNKKRGWLKQYLKPWDLSLGIHW